MSRYQLILAYNGKDYSGFQVQPKQKTIQQALEYSIYRILREKVRVLPSGRTDAGVHALEQSVHFDLLSQKANTRILSENTAHKLNAVLEKNIRVLKIKKCPDKFHARMHVKKKTYVYNLLITDRANPFFLDYVWHHNKPLDQVAMKKAANFLIGRHDFSSFCASDSSDKNKVKEIYKITFSNKNLFPFLSLKGDKFISIKFEGKGFLKQMIRIIVGSLVTVGQKKIRPEKINAILKSKDRTKAFITAPSQGLFLKKVTY